MLEIRHVFRQKYIGLNLYLTEAMRECKSRFFSKNGPATASFCLFSFFSNTNFTEKTVGFSGIQTRIVGVEGDHAEHLTTTTAQPGRCCCPWLPKCQGGM